MLSKERTNNINKILMHVSDLEAGGKHKQAIKAIHDAIKSNLADGNVYNRLGDIYIKTNDTKNAIDAYKKGVSVFKKDTFFRNALALCKKILRYDPANVDIYADIAGILLELDEKSDAIIYYFSYIDKQLEQNNEKAVLKTIDLVKKIGIIDGKVIKKINETYKTLDRQDLLKEFAKEIMQDDVRDDIVLEEIEEAKLESKPKVKEKKAAPSKPVEDFLPHDQVVDLEKKVAEVQKGSDKLDDVVHRVDSAINQLRKAMRLDEVVVALEKSMTALSDDQKQSIALFQSSLQSNLTALQDSVKQMQECSERNLDELRPSITKLGDALSNLDRNQTTFVEQMDESFKLVSKTFNESTQGAVKEVKHVLNEYLATTNDMCTKIDETKECNVSLLQFSEDMKSAVLKMNDSLTKYIIAQEVKEKKQGKLTLAVLIMLAVIIGLFVVNIIL